MCYQDHLFDSELIAKGTVTQLKNAAARLSGRQRAGIPAGGKHDPAGEAFRCRPSGDPRCLAVRVVLAASGGHAVQCTAAAPARAAGTGSPVTISRPTR
jgi:hypothetical protein